MSLPILSQTTSIKETRVKTVVVKGDTLIQFKLSDAKKILVDVLEKEKLDSLVAYYQEKDSLSVISIRLQGSIITNLQNKNNLQIKQNNNLITLISNKDKEISLLNGTIDSQKKEIRKQKILKIIGFGAAAILPIIVLISK